AQVRGEQHVTFDQKRPIRRRASDQKGRCGRRRQRQKADQNLVAPFHHPARVHWADDCCAQWPPARSRLYQREHGRPQARRVRTDPYVQGPCCGQKVQEVSDGNYSCYPWSPYLGSESTHCCGSYPRQVGCPSAEYPDIHTQEGRGSAQESA